MLTDHIAGDTFHNTDSLYHLIQIEAYESQLRAIIDIWRHDGYLPDGRSGNYNGLTQGGSDADNVFPCGLAKGEETTDHRQCCDSIDMCTNNRLCKGPAGIDPIDNIYWRMACTDKSWQSPTCPRFCHKDSTSTCFPAHILVTITDAREDDNASLGMRQVLACEDLPNGNTKFCCLYQGYIDVAKNPYICCNDSMRTFELAHANYWTGAHVMTGWPVNPVAPTNTAATTSPKASQYGARLTNGAKVGIGVGGAVAVLIFVLVALLLYRRWRERKRASSPEILDVHVHRSGLFNFSEPQIGETDQALPTSPTASNSPGWGRQCSASFEIHVEDPRAELSASETRNTESQPKDKT